MKQQVRNKLHGKAGFTLVELIVVIAILGILAGIGTVGYSGYVKKAHQAADNQLLGVVNQAFAAACVENGTSNVAQSGVALATGTTITSVSGGTVAGTSIPTSFEKYFAGNEGTLKYYTNDGDIKFINGMFRVFQEGESVVIDYGGGTLTLPYGAVQNLKDSAFCADGVEALLDKVANVSGIAASMLSLPGTSTQFVEMISGDYADLAHALGVPYDPNATGEDANPEFNAALVELVTQKAQMLAAAEGKTLSDYTTPELSNLMNQAGNLIMANNAVLNAAKNTVGKDTDALLNGLKDGFSSTDIKEMIDTGASGEGLSQAALVYGMYTAYAQRNKIPFDGTDMNAVLTGANTDGFKQYIVSDDAKKDIAGYMGAMEMISNSTGSGENAEAVSNLLLNGFSDEELQKILKDATM